MVPRESKTTDLRFWVSVGGLLLAILGSWATLDRQVTANSIHIGRNREQIAALAADLDRRFDKIETVTMEILKELRK